jgi:hypothetical protein
VKNFQAVRPQPAPSSERHMSLAAARHGSRAGVARVTVPYVSRIDRPQHSEGSSRAAFYGQPFLALWVRRPSEARVGGRRSWCSRLSDGLRWLGGQLGLECCSKSVDFWLLSGCRACPPLCPPPCSPISSRPFSRRLAPAPSPANALVHQSQSLQFNLAQPLFCCWPAFCLKAAVARSSPA